MYSPATSSGSYTSSYTSTMSTPAWSPYTNNKVFYSPLALLQADALHDTSSCLWPAHASSINSSSASSTFASTPSVSCYDSSDDDDDSIQVTKPCLYESHTVPYTSSYETAMSSVSEPANYNYYYAANDYYSPAITSYSSGPYQQQPMRFHDTTHFDQSYRHCSISPLAEHSSQQPYESLYYGYTPLSSEASSSCISSQVSPMMQLTYHSDSDDSSEEEDGNNEATNQPSHASQTTQFTNITEASSAVSPPLIPKPKASSFRKRVRPSARGEPSQRRARVAFTIEQRRYLLTMFAHDSYPTRTVLDECSRNLGLPVLAIQTWFKNTRSKQKKLTQTKNL